MSLHLQNLACVRGDRTLFSDLDLELFSGQVAAVRGTNGSGKTSLLRMIAGLLRPAGGTINWSGASEDHPIQGFIHFLGHLEAIKPAMTVAETLKFWSAMKGGSDDIGAALSAWNLTALADLPCGILSAGQHRRVALSQLDLVPRPLWLLDEPTGPLDDTGIKLVQAAIERHRSSGGIALVATHRVLDMGEVVELDLDQVAPNSRASAGTSP